MLGDAQGLRSMPFCGGTPQSPEVQLPFDNGINRYPTCEIITSVEMVLEIHIASKWSSVQITDKFYPGRTFVLCVSLSLGGLKH